MCGIINLVIKISVILAAACLPGILAPQYKKKYTENNKYFKILFTYTLTDIISIYLELLSLQLLPPVLQLNLLLLHNYTILIEKVWNYRKYKYKYYILLYTATYLNTTSSNSCGTKTLKPKSRVNTLLPKLMAMYD